MLLGFDFAVGIATPRGSANPLPQFFYSTGGVLNDRLFKSSRAWRVMDLYAAAKHNRFESEPYIGRNLFARNSFSPPFPFHHLLPRYFRLYDTLVPMAETVPHLSLNNTYVWQYNSNKSIRYGWQSIPQIWSGVYRCHRSSNVSRRHIEIMMDIHGILHQILG